MFFFAGAVFFFFPPPGERWDWTMDVAGVVMLASIILIVFNIWRHMDKKGEWKVLWTVVALSLPVMLVEGALEETWRQFGETLSFGLIGFDYKRFAEKPTHIEEG